MTQTNSIGIVKHVAEGLVDWQCLINSCETIKVHMTYLVSTGPVAMYVT